MKEICSCLSVPLSFFKIFFYAENFWALIIFIAIFVCNENAVLAGNWKKGGIKWKRKGEENGKGRGKGQGYCLNKYSLRHQFSYFPIDLEL